MDVYLDRQQLKKRRRIFYFKIFLIGFGMAALVAGLTYAIVYSPIFQVNDYVITDNKRLADETVFSIIKTAALKDGLVKFFGENNFLIWPKGEMDVSGTPLLTAKITKNWLSRSVTIFVRERELFAIWCVQNGACYWLDQDGLAFDEAPETEGSLILKVYDQDKSGALLGLKIIEDRFLGNLLVLLDNLKKLNLPVKKIVFDRELQELRLEMYEGPDLMFSIRFDPAPIFNSLQSLLESLDLKRISYIDLRVENRVFYKN